MHYRKSKKQLNAMLKKLNTLKQSLEFNQDVICLLLDKDLVKTERFTVNHVLSKDCIPI